MVTTGSLSLLAIWMWQTIGLSAMSDQCDHGLLVGWSFADHSLTNGKCQGPRANWQESRASLVTAAMETVGRPLHLTFAVSWQEASQDIISPPPPLQSVWSQRDPKSHVTSSHTMSWWCATRWPPQEGRLMMTTSHTMTRWPQDDQEAFLGLHMLPPVSADQWPACPPLKGMTIDMPYMYTQLYVQSRSLQIPT